MDKIINIDTAWLMYEIPFFIKGNTRKELFWALRDISLKIKKGEVLGIVGENGSGKSTLLKLIAGILIPDRGDIEVNGQVAGLLELGAGFQPELNGEENVRLAEKLYGLSQGNMEVIYEKIIKFAGLGKFIYAPVKCYSQGMFVRLAFAIAVHMNAEIFIIDDSLSVGDESFQRKCVQKILELKNQGKTMIIVAHDLNLLRLLCSRIVLLRQGRLIMDDTADIVFPFYSQFFGNKNGVVVLGEGHLKAVFNNGRLLVDWKDKILSTFQGLFSGICINDVWYNSHQASWQIALQDNGVFVMTSRMVAIDLEHKWTLRVDGDNSLFIDMEIQGDSFLQIQEAIINIIIDPAYTKWASLSSRGSFPSIDKDDLSWQFVSGEQSIGSCLCAEASQEQREVFPNIIFDIVSRGEIYQSCLFNADYFNQARIMQFKTRRLQNTCATQEGGIKYFSGRLLLNQPDLVGFLRDKRDKMPLRELFLEEDAAGLRLHIKNGSCQLSCHNQALTKKPYFQTQVNINGTLFSSADARWELEREGMKIIAEGVWPDIPVVQVWQIELFNNSEFSWKVYLKIKEAVEVCECSMRVYLSEQYDCFVSKFGRGEFPEQFNESELDLIQRCISGGEIGLSSSVQALPDIGLTFLAEPHTFAKVFNSDIASRSRIVSVNNISAEHDKFRQPGQYSCLAIQGRLFTGDTFLQEDKGKDLSRGVLRVSLKDGSGCFCWKDAKLTKNLGFYTSLRVNGRWYESSRSAVWAAKEHGEGFVYSGKWLDLPIIQEWRIRLVKDNRIECMIKMIVTREIEVDRLQTNLMLSELYGSWKASAEQNDFPGFDAEADDDWQIVYKDQDAKKVLCVYSVMSEFPSVSFSADAFQSNAQLRILNSDLYHRGRVLQYIVPVKQNIQPGEYEYFRGIISIEGQ